MGLGMLVFLMLCLFAIGAWTVAFISQAKARHRQEMIDLVRGRKPGQNAHETAAVNGARPLSQLAPQKPTDSDVYSRWALQAHEKAAAKAAHDKQQLKSSGSRQPGPCTLNISYVDAKGVWTHRNIAPYKSGATNERFDAWCDTQKGRRTFYFERIQCGTDLQTGFQLSQSGVFQIIHPSRSVPPELE